MNELRDSNKTKEPSLCLERMGFGKTDVQTQTQQNAIEQAQNAVDAINNRIQQTDLKP